MSEENCRGLNLDHRWSENWETKRVYCTKCGEAQDPDAVRNYYLDLPTGTVEVEASDEGDDEFDNANGSKWIVAVDDDGLVSILKRPNIHYSFFDNGSGAEEVGLPFETAGKIPGVYEWICNCVVTHDPETNFPDGVEFHVTNERALYVCES